MPKYTYAEIATAKTRLHYLLADARSILIVESGRKRCNIYAILTNPEDPLMWLSPTFSKVADLPYNEHAEKLAVTADDTREAFIKLYPDYSTRIDIITEK